MSNLNPYAGQAGRYIEHPETGQIIPLAEWGARLADPAPPPEITEPEPVESSHETEETPQ